MKEVLSFREVKEVADSVKGAVDCKCGACQSNYFKKRTKQMGLPADYKRPEAVENIQEDNVIWRNKGMVTEL